MSANYIEGNWHTKIIAAHAESFRTQYGQLRYLEIGVRNAATFNAVLPYTTYAVAVDIADISRFLHPGANFYNLASDDFFQAYDGEPFDMIFIDGLHTADQVGKDFQNSLPVLADNGYIYMHDTWPALTEYTSEMYCGDVYKFVEEVERDYERVFTYQSFPGLTVVQPQPQERQL